MNKVYIVMGHREYEFDWIEKVFSNEEKAKDYLKIQDNSELFILCYEVL